MSRQEWTAPSLLLIAVALGTVCMAGAVYVGVSGQPDVLKAFSAMNSSDLSNLFGNGTTVTFKGISIPSGKTRAEIVNFNSNMTSEKFDVVIGSFHELLATVCSGLLLPFYSLSEKLLDPDATTGAYLNGTTTVLTNSVQDELMLASVNFTNTVAKRKVIVMLVDDVGARLNILYDKNISIEFRISVINASKSSELRQLLFESTQLSSVDTTVYMILSSIPGFAASILQEAVYLSMLKPTAYWIVNSAFLDKREVIKYWATGATIITYRLSNAAITTQSQLNIALATDAIAHYIASSAYNGTNSTIPIMQKIFQTTTDGLVSRLHFDPDERRADRFAVNLMAVDTTNASDLILFATWNESIPNSIVATRTKATLPLPVLRLAGVVSEPFVFVTPTGFSGFCVDVLRKISTNLFTFDINDLARNTTANYLQSVVSGAADITVNLVELTPALQNNSKVSVSEIPLLTSGVASLGRSSVKEIDYLSPLYPLSWNVWFAIILAFLILSATLYLTDKISPNDYRRPRYSIASAAFLVYSSFVMSKLKSSAIKPSSRIFILILWFASLMYCTTYGTNYFFLLVRTNPNLPFTSLSGLSGMKSDYYWVMVKDSPEYRLIAAQNSTMYSQFLNASRFVSSVLDAVGFLKNSTLPNQRKPIFVGDELTMNYYAAKDCLLKSAGKNELTRNLHMVFSSSLDRVLLKTINDRIQELSDKGELEQIKSTYWSAVVCSASENLITYSELTEVTVDQVAGIFMALAAAFVLSFLVVALEHIVYIIGLQVQRIRADPNLQFNKGYRAQVTGITPTGVFVKLHGEKEFIPNHMLSPDTSGSGGMTASDLQIGYGSVIEVTYLGNDPITGYRIFHRRG